MTMRFRDLLAFLALYTRAYGKEWFDSREVSKAIRECAPLAYLNPVWWKRSSVKIVSNELRRLYFMGLLKRRRVKRVCQTKTGKTCYRGYMYKYSISSQGWKYVKRLSGLAEMSPDDIIAYEWIRQNIPPEKRELAWKLYKFSPAVLGRRGGFKRFRSSEQKFYETLIQAWKELARDKRIRTLEKENAELREKIRKLEEENKMLRSKLELMTISVSKKPLRA